MIVCKWRIIPKKLSERDLLRFLSQEHLQIQRDKHLDQEIAQTKRDKWKIV